MNEKDKLEKEVKFNEFSEKWNNGLSVFIYNQMQKSEIKQQELSDKYYWTKEDKITDLAPLPLIINEI